MSETKYNYFKGKAQFTQVKKTNDYGAYSVCLEFVDNDELQKFKDSGIQVEMKDNRVWFRRPHQKLIKNELVTFGPPKVVDTSGADINALIGTGSDIVVKVRSYPTMKGTGHTLDAIQVINLVEVTTSNNGSYYNF